MNHISLNPELFLATEQGRNFRKSLHCIQIYIKRDNKVSDLIKNNFLRFSRHSPGFIFASRKPGNGCHLALFIAPFGFALPYSLFTVCESIALFCYYFFFLVFTPERWTYLYTYIIFGRIFIL